MEAEKILTKAKMPFCPGCGHIVNTRSITKALQDLGYGTKDVVMVSDIGCSGLVDPLFASHTIHGLHGRSPALGVGVALGLNTSGKKVIVIQGDGGATIGLQHILEASRRNIDLTLVVFNNLLFGMTGGQVSGLSTNQFKDYKQSADNAEPYDIVSLAHKAGAAFSIRVNDMKRFNEVLKEAIATPGFSLVEMTSLCTSYSMKKMSEFQYFTVDEERLVNDRPIGFTRVRRTKSLLKNLKGLNAEFPSNYKNRVGVVIAGSAGGGVQSAAKLLAQAGMLAGLNVSMKGEYPITVGTGFSVAEVILSKEKIHFTGLEKPNVMLVVSDDGWNKVNTRVSEEATVFVDAKIGVNHTAKTRNFVKVAGKKGAALSAVSYWLKESGIFPVEALEKVVENHKYAEVLLSAIRSADKL